MEEEKIKSDKKNAVWIRLIVLLSLLGATWILWETGFIQMFFKKDRLLAFIDSLGPMGFVGFIALQAAQVVLAPIPGEVTGLIGGYLYGLLLGSMLSTAGLIIGSYVAFAIAKAFGRPFVERFVDKSVMDRFDYLLHHKGVFLVFMLFLLPGFPKDYLCFILGLGHLSTVEFLVISSLGRFFGTLLLTLGGGFIRYQEYEKLFILVGVAIVLCLVAFISRHRIERLLKSLHLKDC